MLGWLKNRVREALPGEVSRDLRGDGWHVQLDLSPQVLSLAIPDGEGTWPRGGEAELAPTCSGLAAGFVSASMLAVKAKLFDDGLYAAVELATQPAKAKLLARLVNVAPVIAAAACLGGVDAPFSDDVQRITEAFLVDEQVSKPLGFYTWSAALRRIFQQDRLLQQELDLPDVAALTAALEADPASKAAYGAYLDFVAQLTNPLVSDMPDLRKPNGRWFFPPSQSLESALVKRLYGDRFIPDGWSLADEIVKRLRDGSLKIDLTDSSGWYDLQTWALEPLVRLDEMPEGARLKIDNRYREQLEDVFKAILALTRETHVKQLQISMAGSALRAREVVVPIRPDLTVEPIRTYYERRALGYQFVRHVLDSVCPLKLMHRVTDVGSVMRPLDEELAEMTALMVGAATTAGEELGMAADGSRLLRSRPRQDKGVGDPRVGQAPAPDLIRRTSDRAQSRRRGARRVWRSGPVDRVPRPCRGVRVTPA